MSPDVTVVIPTRNRRAYLEHALGSALAQEGAELEVVVIDEGSSDDTPEWLEAHPDPRLRTVRHDIPRKLPGARNAGLEVARGEWIAFLDDDDVWAPSKLREQLNRARETRADWVYVGSVTVDADLHPMSIYPGAAEDDLRAGLLKGNCVPGGGSGVMVRTSALREVGGFNETLIAAEDWECWLRLCDRYAAAAVRRPLMAYRLTGGSMSHDIDRMERAHAQVRALHPMVSPSSERKSWALLQRYMAFQLVRNGQPREAARRLVKSAGPLPTNAALSLWVVATRRTWRRPQFLWSAEAQAWMSEADRWLAPYRL